MARVKHLTTLVYWRFIFWYPNYSWKVYMVDIPLFANWTNKNPYLGEFEPPWWPISNVAIKTKQNIILDNLSGRVRISNQRKYLETQGGSNQKVLLAESLKAAATAAIGGGTFWTSGEHFGPKYTLFCWICSFVANHACLTVF